MPANESTQSQQFINSAARMIADQVDLDKILSLASAKKSVDMPVSVIASDHPSSTVDKLLRLSRLIRRHKP
jgi:cobyrinic acid a,c-diamide synthase